MTAHRIIKSLVNRGNAVVGIGCYSAAMACQSNSQKIIKVGTDMEDPWLDYYYEIIKPMQGNPFVPKVYSFYHDEANEYFICQMEKLIAIKDIHGAKTTESAKEVTSAIKQWIQADIDDSEFEEVCKINWRVIKPTEIPQLMAIIKQIQEFTDVMYEDDSEMPDCARRLDLHSGNIMFRDPATPVIIDPWCHNVMDDVSDLTQWAETYNLEW